MAGRGYRLTIDRAVVHAVGMAEANRRVLSTGRRVFNRASILTPVDTGRLRAGNQFTIRRGATTVTMTIFNNTSYAEAVHDGFAAHTIRPARRKALRFVAGGHVVFAKSVRMPARRGRPWLTRALREIAIPDGFAVTTA